MANVALFRIDQRLIHGQVVAMWIKLVNAKQVIIIDEDIAGDPFMKQIFMMAAPPGCKLQIFTNDQAVTEWKKDRFGPVGPVMILTRTVKSAYSAYMKGYEFPTLLVGALGGAPGRFPVWGPITLNEEDAKMLKELSDKGCQINFQPTPNQSAGTWAAVRAKHFPKI
jgi:mannose/fructose/N-acetylgalactosamine-specific phosphotransferase system component IIB